MRLNVFFFKGIDAVAWKKINLSRHQAQEQLQRGTGVNCESPTMPALQMDFSVCVSCWDACCTRGEGGGQGGSKGKEGKKKKKAMVKESNFVSTRPNFVTGVILIH